MNDLKVENAVYLNVGSEFADIVPASQLLLDLKLRESGVNNWRIKLHQGCVPDKYCVDLTLDEGNAYWVSEFSREITISYAESILVSNMLPDMVASLLLQIFDQEISMFKNFNNPAQKELVAYSPQYHVTFSLFAQGGSPVSWDISEALETYFRPLQTELSRVANFTVDTQVQFYSTLSNAPYKVAGTDGKGDVFQLTQDDLSTFVNFADWSLSSIHSYPTLNFILFIPSPKYTPLLIADSSTNSFLIPQWGGVAILNPPEDSAEPTKHVTEKDLLPVLEIFSSQLFSLLGAPTIPKSPLIRIDILSRISALRALLTSASSLGSLHRVSQSLPDIAIPKSVLVSVNSSLFAISESLAALKAGLWADAIKQAGIAMTQSHKAFFEKEMVQQAFFPEEHKVAVYLPLLGPVCVVILMGLLRLKKELKA